MTPQLARHPHILKVHLLRITATDPQCRTSNRTIQLAHLHRRAMQTTTTTHRLPTSKVLMAHHRANNMVPHKDPTDSHLPKAACTISKVHLQEDTRTTEEGMEARVAV